MYLIEGLSKHSFQKQRLILPNGDPILLTIQFKPQQFGWFITSLSYDPTDFLLKSARIVVSPNMLYQYKNQIPFGLACFTANGQEPTQQEDFSSGFASLYILSEAEVEAFSELISGQAGA
jgi:hypothetical protein